MCLLGLCWWEVDGGDTLLMRCCVSVASRRIPAKMLMFVPRPGSPQGYAGANFNKRKMVAVSMGLYLGEVAQLLTHLPQFPLVPTLVTVEGCLSAS